MTTKAQLAATLNVLPDNLAVAALLWVDPTSDRVMSVAPNVSMADATRLMTWPTSNPGDVFTTGAADQPLLTATYGAVETGQGGTAMEQGAFTAILLDAVVTDTRKAYDLATGIYTVPEDGAYDVRLKLRLADGDLTGTSYGIGAGVAAQDGPGFAWFVGAPKRQGAQYSETIALKRGDQLRPFYYLDGAPTTYIAADLTILRVA